LPFVKVANVQDIRVYTIWQAEFFQSRNEGTRYERTPREWELLGVLAHRLNNISEANEAFEYAIEKRFSMKAYSYLLENYEKRHVPIESLIAISKLASWNRRWYSDFSPRLVASTRKVIASEGLLKVTNTLRSRSEDLLTIMNRNYFSLAVAFQWYGCEA
jgi:hypothetical protein